MSSQKLTLDSLEENGWTLADDKQHPLGNLQGKALDSYELVVLSGIRNRFGASSNSIPAGLAGMGDSVLERTRGADQAVVEQVLEKARQVDSRATEFYLTRWSIIKKTQKQRNRDGSDALPK